MKVSFNINLTKGQKEAYALTKQSDIKYLTLVWSRQSGKTVFTEIILIETLFKSNKLSGYISPTFQLGRKVYKEVVKLLEPTNIIKSANASTLTIESIYGSTIQFYSADAYTSIRGNTISDVLIVDEAAYMPDMLPNGELLWSNVIMPITKARCKKIIFVSTPHGKNGFFYEQYIRALNNEKGYGYLQKTIHDDDLVTEEQLVEIKRTTPSLAFKQEFECEFLDSSITVFNGFEYAFKDDSYQEGRNTWLGIDLSTVGDDNTIITFINDLNQVKQVNIETISLDNKYKEITKYINNTTKLKGVYIETNSIGTPMYNEIIKLVSNKYKDYVEPFETTHSSKINIIDQLAIDIANNNISFNKEDKELFSEFSTFTYTISKSKNIIYGAKQGFHDDRVMSLAIALEARYKLNKVITLKNFGFLRDQSKHII